MDNPPHKYSPAHHHPLTVAAVVGSFAMAVGLVVRVSGILLEGRLAGFRVVFGAEDRADADIDLKKIVETDFRHDAL